MFLQDLNRFQSENGGDLRSLDIVYYETEKQAHFDNTVLRRATIQLMSEIEFGWSRGL
jgi:hypothetical protein